MLLFLRIEDTLSVCFRFILLFLFVCLSYCAHSSLGHGPVAMAAKHRFAKEKKQVLKLYHHGKKLVIRRSYKKALAKFFQATDLVIKMLSKHPTGQEKKELIQSLANFHYIIGRTFEYRKQWQKAYDAYRQSLALEPKNRIKVLAKNRMSSLLSKVFVMVEIRSTPTDAMLVLQDAKGLRYSARTPYIHFLPPGKLQLTLKLAKYQTIEETITLDLGSKLHKRYVLQPVAHIGKVIIRTRVPPPVRKIVPKKPKGVQISSVVAWSGAFGAFLLAGAGTTLLVFANQEFSHYRDKRGNATYSTDLVARHYDQGQRFFYGSIAAFGVAGALLLVSTSVFIWRSGRKKSTTEKNAQANTSTPDSQVTSSTFRLSFREQYDGF